ncbi:hypothetical protein DCW30_06755 [Streptomyces alfalfae]|uniref:Uncharacterized protein n=1 Tax=Streptomyces alfalfae TaxID=1642299 RepID=A0ABM6GXD0_9ACTN|nr:hypothetical protein [Streptomyces alfalfae]AYA18418.1 hypothetical protein D3X13_21230 [Streptomyces fradiae]APY88039.1 hypothetical protein A7J05_22130 [Streptomyces alfalfae]QUI31994.1 hypothetical protein H9W91_14825 [Streptomyces alfalfae]RXX46175.1 hypothetical protein DCW30_06755 [Streptomyces alfalfae]RZM92156.1 hypothetical protein D4104_21580 [Streptomyces alfalfae]
MPAPRYIVEDSARDPRADIWFALPSGFTELPLDVLTAAPGSPAARRLGDALGPVVGAMPEGARRELFVGELATAQRLLLTLRGPGTVHCSLGLHRDDSRGRGRPLLCLFTVAWQGIGWSPRRALAAVELPGAERHTRVEYRDLPCGPASISEVLRMPAEEAGLPARPLLQVHARLPHPDGQRMAVLTLTTAAVVRRAQYRALLGRLARLVSFEDPLVTAP